MEGAHEPRSRLERYYTLWREMTLMYDDWARQAYGLTYNSVLVLDALYWKGEGCTQTDICRQCLLPKQTVHTILKEFERQGLLRLSARADDRRSKAISLTAEGRRFVAEVVARMEGLDRKAMDRMGPERVDRMLQDLADYIQFYRERMNGDESD